MSKMSRSDGDETYSSLRKVDTKFAVFPAAFVVLRIWRCLQIAWLIYNPEGHSTPAGIRYALAFLSVSFFTRAFNQPAQKKVGVYYMLHCLLLSFNLNGYGL